MLVVAFEGFSGSGKSTAIRALVRHFSAKKLKVGIVSIDSAKNFADLKKIEKQYPIIHQIRDFLFLVLRIQQGEKIEEMRKRGYNIVLIDRYVGSSCVFMKCGGFPNELISWLKKNIKPKPDITLFFDLPYTIAKKRKRSRSIKQIDQSSLKMIEKTYKSFAKKEKWKHINAHEQPEDVQRACIKQISTALKRKK